MTTPPPDDRSRMNSDAPPTVAKELRDLDRRLQALDTREQVHHTEIVGKLQNGYESFERARAVDTELAKQIVELQQETRPRKLNLGAVLGIISLVMAIGGTLVTVVSTASTYVDRPTLERALDRSQQERNELRDEVASLNGRMIRLETRLEQVDSARAQLSILFESVLEASKASNRGRGR